jgi:hypothetical protein
MFISTQSSHKRQIREFMLTQGIVACQDKEAFYRSGWLMSRALVSTPFLVFLFTTGRFSHGVFHPSTK